MVDAVHFILCWVQLGHYYAAIISLCASNIRQQQLIRFTLDSTFPYLIQYCYICIILLPENFYQLNLTVPMEYRVPIVAFKTIARRVGVVLVANWRELIKITRKY